MPLFKPCNCPEDIGAYAVYSGSSPTASPATRMKYGFASQMVQFGSATAGAGTTIQAARGPVSSYLFGNLLSGTFDVEEYNRGTDARTTVTNPWGLVGGGVQNNGAVPLAAFGESLFFRNVGFNCEFLTVLWATNTYTVQGSFGGGATVAGNATGAVSDGSGVTMAGNASFESNATWSYNRVTNTFTALVATIVQAGQLFMSASGPVRGYFMGGQAGGVPFQTNVRYTYNTQAYQFTNNLPSQRSQGYAAFNSELSVCFPGGLSLPANAIAQTECIRMKFATETSVFSTVLVPQATNTAGA